MKMYQLVFFSLRNTKEPNLAKWLISLNTKLILGCYIICVMIYLLLNYKFILSTDKL